MANSTAVVERVAIGAMVEGGRCIARVDGLVLFVAQVAPGDVADLRIVKKKKGYAEAVPVYIHSQGPGRVTPFCEHFGVCGGCQWQHVDYAAQVAAKERLVIEKLVSIAHIEAPPVAPILPAEATTYYRNKLEFTFSNQRWLSAAEIEADVPLDRCALGFYRPGRFDRIVDIAHCYLQPAPANAIRVSLANFAKAQGLSFYDLRGHTGLLRNLIVRTATTGEVMVIVQFGQAVADQVEQVMRFLRTKFPALTSLQYVVNTKRNSTFYDLPVHVYHGQPWITERLDELQFRIGPKSFFQTNTAQALVLYRKILALADLRGDEVLYDLYTGVGSIALFLARHARHVVGIEVTEEAIVDAQGNAACNNITNTTFVAGDVARLLDAKFLAQHGTPSVVVTDPPRAGMCPKVIQQLLQIAPTRIVYVSCNPATQARDIALLRDRYQLVTAQPVDMFPHTSHVENIALLRRY